MKAQKATIKRQTEAISRIMLFVLVILPCALNAQQSLLSKTTNKDFHQERFGQNLNHYIHAYGGIGMMAGPAEKGGRIIYGVSLNPEIGGRYKFKIYRHYSVGVDATYNLYSYKLKQENGKHLPDTIIHKAERFLFSSLTLGLFHRFNLGRVGNYIGKFIDLGVYGEWVHYSDHYFKDKMDNGNNISSHVSGLDYVNNHQYGAYARFGITRYAFMVKYRLSDYYKKSAGLPDLPRFTFSVQVGIHKVN